MVSPIEPGMKRAEPRVGCLGASLTAMISAVRGVLLLSTTRPGTPLRAMCLMALDTVHVFRTSQRLSLQRLKTVASLLDCGACANDFFDGNDFSRRKFRATCRMLDRAELCVPVSDYLGRLRALEKRRPVPGGDNRRHRQVQTYREAVIRLSLGMAVATALGNLSIQEGTSATHDEKDIELLFRIVMLCQIIDDILDYTNDTVDGVPSFLTAHASPSQALTLTSDASTCYAYSGELPSSPHLLPFRVALWGVTVLAKLAIVFGQWRLRMPGGSSGRQLGDADRRLDGIRV